jgi:hypothetical protein
MIALWAIASAVIGFGFSLWAVNNGLEVPISTPTLGVSISVIALGLRVMVVRIWN